MFLDKSVSRENRKMNTTIFLFLKDVVFMT